MRRILITCFLGIFIIQFAFSQNGEHVYCGHFLKRVEYNLVIKGNGKSNYIASIDCYNFSSKGEVEKRFFGDFNAPVEFFYAPSFEGASGFRIMRDSLDMSYILEIKLISNYDEAVKVAGEEAREKQKQQLIDLPVKMLDSLPRHVFNQIFDYNNSIHSGKIYIEILPKYIKVKNLSYSISNQFAEKLHEKMVSFIDNFKAKGVPPIISDGYSATFRTVVDDEVWSLYIHMPQGDALKMADLCRLIITDANADKLDESKYLKLLDF